MFFNIAIIMPKKSPCLLQIREERFIEEGGVEEGLDFKKEKKYRPRANT